MTKSNSIKPDYLKAEYLKSAPPLPITGFVRIWQFLRQPENQTTNTRIDSNLPKLVSKRREVWKIPQTCKAGRAYDRLEG